MASQTLYRFWDAEDALLYVGISVRPWDRWKQHRGDKPWWEEVATVTLQTFATREEVSAAEVDAIRAENPRYNIAGRATTEPVAVENEGVVDGCAPYITGCGEWMMCACLPVDWDDAPDDRDFGRRPHEPEEYRAYEQAFNAWFEAQPLFLPETYAQHVIETALGDRFAIAAHAKEPA